MTKQEFFDTPCTIFDCCASNNGRTSTFGDFLNDESHISTIGKLRSETDPEKRKVIKSSMLPAATLAACFPTGARGNGQPRKLSGFWCVDVDAQDNPEHTPAQLKEIVAGCLQTLWCAYSVSGKGVYAIVKLACPERHKAHFKALQRLFMERLGLRIDKSCSDVERLRIASFDPNPYFNGDAETFAILDDDADEHPEYFDGAEQMRHAYAHDPQDDAQRAEACVVEIERQGIDLCPTREEWIECGMELHSLGNDIGKPLFERISALWQAKAGQTTSAKDINNAWRSFKVRESGRGIASFFHRCAKHGITPHCSRLPETQTADIFAELI